MVDRISEGSAKSTIETLLPDPEIRTRMLGALAESIEASNGEGSSCWSITLHPNHVNTNVGRCYAFSIWPNRVHLTAMELEGQQLPGEVNSGHFKSAPEIAWADLSTEELVGNWEQWRPFHLAAVKRAAATARTTPYLGAHSPGVLKYLRTVLGRDLPDPDHSARSLPDRVAERLVHLVERRYPDWSGFSDPAFLDDEDTYKRKAVDLFRDLLGREELAQLIASGQFDEVIARIKKVVQATNLLWTAVPKQSDVGILHQDEFDPATFCPVFHDLLHGEGETFGRLAEYNQRLTELNLLNRWTFATYFLLLSNPQEEFFVKPNATTFFLKELSIDLALGTHPDPDIYVEIVSAAEALREKLQNYEPRDLLDIQGFVWVAYKNSTAPPDAGTDRPPPAEDRRIWKIAPGENARLWDECREGGYIAIGWNEIGDLSELGEVEFEARLAEVAEEQHWNPAGPHQLWTFANIKEGDQVVANNGTKEVVGIGAVTGPYYFEPEGEYHHRLPVDWYDVEPREVTQPGWRRTVLELHEQGFEKILNQEADPTPVDDAFLSPRAFELLAGIHEEPTSNYWAKHKSEFHDEIEEPFKRLFADLAERLPNELKNRLELQTRLFGKFAKNDYGRGGAWPYYWGAFYPKGGRRIADTQLFVWVDKDRLEYGFGFGDYGGDQDERFRRNAQSHKALLKEAFSDTFDRADFEFRMRSEPFPEDPPAAEDFWGWIENFEGFGSEIRVVVERAALLAKPGEALQEDILDAFQRFTPLVILASEDDPLPFLVGGEETLNEPYTIEQFSSETGFAVDQLQSWVRAIERKGQAVLYGPPGTGKTYVAERLARHLIGGTTGTSELVQFHPAYSYEDFMQGIRPKAGPDGTLTYPTVKGRFMEFCRTAERTSDPCVLIIDEINRANLARVFGELMYLLEYRGNAIPLAGSGEFRIPSNVRIIGTMNTADRSIALVDHALRRRFAFLALAPDFRVLERYHEREQTGFDPRGLIHTLERLNHKIADPNYSIGITFFLRIDIQQQVEDIWEMEILPYLAEYFFDSPQKVAEFEWPKVEQAILEWNPQSDT